MGDRKTKRSSRLPNALQLEDKKAYSEGHGTYMAQTPRTPGASSDRKSSAPL